MREVTKPDSVQLRHLSERLLYSWRLKKQNKQDMIMTIVVFLVYSLGIKAPSIGSTVHDRLTAKCSITERDQ